MPAGLKRSRALWDNASRPHTSRLEQAMAYLRATLRTPTRAIFTNTTPVTAMESPRTTSTAISQNMPDNLRSSVSQMDVANTLPTHSPSMDVRGFRAHLLL